VKALKFKQFALAIALCAHAANAFTASPICVSNTKTTPERGHLARRSPRRIQRAAEKGYHEEFAKVLGWCWCFSRRMSQPRLL